VGVDGEVAFLPFLELLQLCAEYGLPVNDTWLVAGQRSAADMRRVLDAAAASGHPTSHVLRTLSQVLELPHATPPIGVRHPVN
jgi:hypothetical protein